MAALDADSLAYLTIREGEDDADRFWEIGVIGHGSRAADLAEHLVTEIRAWHDGWGNTAPEPGFRMAVGDARDRLTATDPRFVIDKPYSQLVVDWPRKGLRRRLGTQYLASGRRGPVRASVLRPRNALWSVDESGGLTRLCLHEPSLRPLPFTLRRSGGGSGCPTHICWPGQNGLLHGSGVRRAIVSGISTYGPTQPDDSEPDGSEPEPLDPLGFVSDRTELVAESLAALGFSIDGGRPHVDVASSELLGRLNRVSDSAGGGQVVIHHVGHGLVGRGGSLLLPGRDWAQNRSGATTIDVDALINRFEESPEGPDVLLLLDVCQAGKAARAQVRMMMDDSDRKVWVVGAAGHGSAAFDGRFSQAVATTLRGLAKGALDVHPSLKHVPVRVFAAEVQRELDRLCVMEGASVPQKLEMTPQFHPFDSAPAFFCNPWYRTEYTDTVLAVRESALGMFLRDLDPAFDPVHYLSRASGDPDRRSATGQCYFTGREQQLEELTTWLEDTTGRHGNLRVVTGSPGVGKSALIGMLVCAAHPRLRPLATGITSRVHPDRLPSLNHRLIAVHARGLSLNEVIDSLARQLDMEQPLGRRWNPRDFCFEVISREAGVPAVVLDALDEATEPEAILNHLLIPLATMKGRHGGNGCRLLVGVRPWQQFEPLLAAARESEGGLVNLDQVPLERVREELADYVRALLAGSTVYGVPEYRTLRTEAASIIADALSMADMGGRFLVAGLYVQLLTALPVEQMSTATVAAQVPRSLGDVLELHLRELGPGQLWLRPVLAALGRVKGEGMSRRLLVHAARAFGPGSAASPVPRAEAAIEEVLRLVTFYLRTTAGPDGLTVYRFFHQALADHMTLHPYGRSDPIAPAAVANRVYEALLDSERPSPLHRPNWRNAEPYLLRHLLEHATEAGRADELVLDSEFLAHADPRHLVPLLDGADSEAARLMAAAYRTSGPHHLTASPYQRRQLLSVDLARWADLRASVDVMHHPDAPPPAWACTTATGSGVYTSYLGSLQGHEGPASKLLVAKTSERLVVSLGEDRSVRAWNLTAFEQQAYADADADAMDTIVIGGEEVVVTLTLESGQIRLWDLPSLRPRGRALRDADRLVTEMHTYPATHGPYLVTRSSGGVVQMWDLEEGVVLGKKGIRKPSPVEISTEALEGQALGLRFTGKRKGVETLIWDMEARRFIGYTPVKPEPPADTDDPEREVLDDLEDEIWDELRRLHVSASGLRRLSRGRTNRPLPRRRQKSAPQEPPVDEIAQQTASLLPSPSAAFVTMEVGGDHTVLVAQPDGSIHVWRLMPGAAATRVKVVGHSKPVVELTHVQDRAVSRGADDTVLHSGAVLRVSGLSSICAAVVPDIGPVVLAAGVQGRLNVVEGWGQKTPKTRRIARYRNRVTRILPVGDACFITSAAGRLRYWKLVAEAGQYSSETLWSLRLPSAVTAMAPLPSGLLVATAQDGTALIEWRSGGRILSVQPPSADHRVVELAATAAGVVALSENGSLELWDLVPRKAPTTLSRGVEHLANDATCVAAAPDGGRPLIATGHGDRSLRVLDVETRRVLGPPMWLPDTPRAVTWISSRRLAVSCGPDVVELDWLIEGQ
ncbi:hypothetical protein [Kitasatospora purpeofusca]|uniref:hypothetical protein n=1 Tax=Kitasatospora purpeofusca TaxID=67352 RepID=UPI000B06CE64|nr:hypothetical protein [Kitasatospora purpeofusca]